MEQSMSNYDILVFLAADGGRYTRNEHLELLNRTFPDLDITLTRVSSLRSSMLQSRFITADVVKADRQSFIRVTGVDEEFRNYSFKRPKESQPRPMDSYLLSEPAEVVRTIKLRMEFDNLLRQHHATGNRERSTQCGRAMPR